MTVSSCLSKLWWKHIYQNAHQTGHVTLSPQMMCLNNPFNLIMSIFFTKISHF